MLFLTFVLASLVAAPQPAAPTVPALQPPQAASQPPPEAATPPPPEAATPPAPGAAMPPGTQARYQIGPDDTLRVTVFEADNLTGTYRVDTDGFVTFPLLGRIPAGGLTVGAFQDKLRTALANGYIRNPQVRVEVEEYKSQSVFVSGEVRAPAEIRMSGGMTLLKALAQAGSPTSSASSELTIARPKKVPPGTPPPPAGSPEATEVIRVNWRDLQVGKASDVVLQDGDVIYVPKAQTFYIQGFVRNGGSYVLEPGTTVEQAIALAGGITDRGTTRGIKATRNSNGRSIEVSLTLSDLVKAGDVITIKQRLF
jgi:polysaccharide biosynthesis/export protein